jgi:formate dehydrogenase maturation protein FdhE
VTQEQKARSRALVKRLIAGDVPAADELARLYDAAGMGHDAVARYGKLPMKLADFVTRHVLDACPACGSLNVTIKDYGDPWRDGEVTCDDCGTYVRMY